MAPEPIVINLVAPIVLLTLGVLVRRRLVKVNPEAEAVAVRHAGCCSLRRAFSVCSSS